MDYRIALENAQRNAEQQKRELEKTTKGTQKPTLSVPAAASITLDIPKPISSSGHIDPAKVKQYLERRKQEQLAAKMVTPPTPASQKLHQPPAAKSSLPGGKSKSDQRPGSSSTHGNEAKKRPSTDGVKPAGASAASVPNKKSKILPAAQSAKSGEASTSASPSASSATRQYLQIRRQELLKELEKIDKKLHQLDHQQQDQRSKPPPAPAKKSPPPPPPPQQQQHSKSHSRGAVNSNGNSSSGNRAAPSAPRAKQLPQPPSQQDRSLGLDDSDADEDDDSFIDDTEAGGQEAPDFSSIVREVHRSLRFDPRRYATVNPYDDCRGMVASYGDVQREERRSRIIGQMEDAADERLDEERRRRRMEKRKAKGKA